MTLFRLEFSSYDGCNGWTNWFGEEVYTNQDKAAADAKKYEKRDCRCKVVSFEPK